jgi:hypothetical protein
MRHADKPTVEEELYVEATPARLWPIVTDIGLLARVSDELVAAEWADEGGGPATGRCFVGTNRNKYFGEWQTTSTVVQCEEPTLFGWAVGDVAEPNTSWRFTLRPSGTGTVATQWMQLGLGESGLHAAIKARPDKEERIVEVRLIQFRAGMRANLEEIKRLAEQA